MGRRTIPIGRLAPGRARRGLQFLRPALIGFAAFLLPGSAQPAVVFECDSGEPAATMVLFDGHDHLRVDTEALAVANLITLAGKGVSAGMLALGTPDSGDLAISLGLQASSSHAVFAFINPPAGTDPSTGEKVFDATSLAFVQVQLGEGARGVGEMSVRHSGPPALGAEIPADSPGAMALYAEAALWGVPVTVHFETRDKSAPGADVASRVEELRAALAANPETTFIWAHMGDTGPDTVRSLIEEFDNLYADISTRNPYYVRGWPMALQSLGDGPEGLGNLKSSWRLLFEDHPARFLFGLDLASSTRWDQLDPVMTYYRAILAELSQATAEKIGCANARVLLVAPGVPGPGAEWFGVLALALSCGALLALNRARAAGRSLTE